MAESKPAVHTAAPVAFARTPFHCGGDGIWRGNIYGADGIIVATIDDCYPNADEHRRLIVRSVNSHEASVEALRCVWAGVPDRFREDIGGMGSQEIVLVPVMVGALDKVRRALALAEEQ